MKKYNLIGLFSFLLILGLTSCDPEIVEYGAGDTTTLVVTNPYLQVETPVVSFQAGEVGYDIAFNAINPTNSLALSSVNVYNTFSDAADEDGVVAVSNTALFKSYTIPGGGRTVFSETITYDDLKAGLTLDGSPLPASDFDLAIGSGWQMTFEGVRADGTTVPLVGSIRIAVLSPFAGIYEAVQTAYFRIGVESGLTDWSGDKIFIGSVDANTFSHVDAWGPFNINNYGVVGQFVFDLLPDNTIEVLDDPSQLFFSGQDMLTCQEDEAIFANVPCEGSNILVTKPTTGAHELSLTYGYFTTGSGPREFYEKLIKVVE